MASIIMGISSETLKAYKCLVISLKTESESIQLGLKMETAFLHFSESLGNCYDHSHFGNRILTNILHGSVLSPELNSEHSGSLNSKKKEENSLSQCLFYKVHGN